jgi:hypothetical protein
MPALMTLLGAHWSWSPSAVRRPPSAACQLPFSIRDVNQQLMRFTLPGVEFSGEVRPPSVSFLRAYSPFLMVVGVMLLADAALTAAARTWRRQ